MLECTCTIGIDTVANELPEVSAKIKEKYTFKRTVLECGSSLMVRGHRSGISWKRRLPPAVPVPEEYDFR